MIKIEEKQYYQKLTLRYKIFKIIVKDYNELAKNIRLGDIVKITGTNLNIDTNHIPNAFNYKQYFYNNLYLYEIKLENIEIINHKFTINFFNQIVNDYLVTTFKDESLIILQGFILGDTTNFSDSLNNELKVNGIIHLFAISGSHIVLIISFLEKILNKSKNKNKTINIILFLYLLITKFSISISRAIITYYVNQLCRIMKIKFTALDISSFVFICFIMINPYFMYNMGFILSFASTFLIILISTFLKNISNIKSILIITLVINIFAFPFTINMNNEFNVLSIFINIIMILLVEGVIIPLSFIVFIFPIFDVVYKYIISGFLYLNKLISLFCYKIGFVINIGSISEYYIFIYYLLVILLIIFINKKRIFSFIICLLSCFLLVIIFNISIIPKKEITFLDLYNGESTLIEYKNEIILIDCGEGINNEVTSFLKTKGIRKIDYLILTHNHSDHNGEALNIVKNFRVKNIVVSIYDNSIYSKYDNVNKIKKGDIIKTKFIDIYCLSPYQSSNNENNNSLVLYFIIDEIRFLFTGDIELEIEEELPKLEVDVLKVAHHGSITSSSTSFLNKIRPKYSVIMSGRSNIYEFPNDNIINRLDNINSKVYCTRDCYSIILKISCFGKMKWHTLKKPITFN